MYKLPNKWSEYYGKKEGFLRCNWWNSGVLRVREAIAVNVKQDRGIRVRIVTMETVNRCRYLMRIYQILQAVLSLFLQIGIKCI